jgi:sarcosine oxidase, subunit beta
VSGVGEVSVDVAVVGAGIVGAVCAAELAGAGLRVAVLEREEAAGTGSTGLSAAGVRVQFVEPTNVALSLASIETYRSFPERHGVDVGYRPVGYLLLVPDADWQDHLAGVAVQQAMGAPVEVLEIAEARRRFVELDPGGLGGATFGPIDGVVDPHTVTQAHLGFARELGASIHVRHEIVEVARDGADWLLATSITGAVGGMTGAVGGMTGAVGGMTGAAGGMTGAVGPVVRAGAVVNAAGCWAGALGRLAGLEVPVEPSRRMIWMTAPRPGRATSPMVVDLGSGLYHRTEGQRLLFGRSNPDEAPGFVTGIDWAWSELTFEAAVGRFPWFADEALDQSACWYGYYEVTPDHNAVLGEHPGAAGWYDACGFSGHGVQHAPAVGRAIREELVDGRSHTIDIDPLRLARFAGGMRRDERHII